MPIWSKIRMMNIIIYCVNLYNDDVDILMYLIITILCCGFRIQLKSTDLSLRNIFGKKSNFCYINYDKWSYNIGKTIAFSPKSNTEIRLALGIRRVGRHGNLNNKLRTVEEKRFRAFMRQVYKTVEKSNDKIRIICKIMMRLLETSARRNADDIKNIMHTILLS